MFNEGYPPPPAPPLPPPSPVAGVPFSMVHEPSAFNRDFKHPDCWKPLSHKAMACASKVVEGYHELDFLCSALGGVEVFRHPRSNCTLATYPRYGQLFLKYADFPPPRKLCVSLLVGYTV